MEMARTMTSGIQATKGFKGLMAGMVWRMAMIRK